MFIKLTQDRAFSLIELLVVITIIGVLSFLGLIQYQAYVMRAKISQAMIVIDNIGEQAKIYYDMNSVFPNLQQANLTYDPSSPNQSPMANTLSDYMANYIAYTYLQDEGNAFTCPSASYGGYISNLAAGDYLTTGQNGSFININKLLVYVNRSYMLYCQYYYLKYDPTSQISNYVSGDIIPECSNGFDDPDAGDYFTNAANQC